MKWLLFVFLGISVVRAERDGTDVSEKNGEGEKLEVKKYDVNLVIAKSVANLKEPRFWKGVGDVGVPVFSSSKKVQKHVNHGFALLHASWDFEAYRHFAVALKEDPNCLMAYCGVVLALTNPEHEFKEERARAVNRMLSLAEEKGVEEGTFYYPDIERGYAFSLGILLTDGVIEGGKAFRKLARRYPGDIQIRLLAAFLSRGGYSEFGDVRPAQTSALSVVKDLLKAEPENAFVMNFLVMMQAEAPYQAVDFKKDLLPYSKKLVELSGGEMPTWHALLGHMAWRCGELDLAESSFRKSIMLYEAWKEEDGIANADIDGLVKAKLFLAAVKYAQGDLEKAQGILAEVNSISVEMDRKLSPVAVTLKWHGNLMPFHMYFARGEAGDFDKAKAMLPRMIAKKKKGVDAYGMVLDGYGLFLKGVEEVRGGKLANAKKTHATMADLLKKMEGSRVEVMKTRQFSDYMKHYRSLFAHHYELAGMIAGKKPLAFNWFKSAIDAQRPGSRLLPEKILYPMELRLAQFYDGKGNQEGALDYAKRGNERMPSCPKSIKLLEKLSN